ncbi:aldehyde dehydrogenase [Aureococcus anophagefferens]|uniref:Aldehyde dehydrogenase n=1 Tax=Aureococcus anophagefferens TaxID=44056 RepID=A0ABR1G7L6_AURAN
MACFQEECFAPVVALAAFDDEADAMRAANANAPASARRLDARRAPRAPRRPGPAERRRLGQRAPPQRARRALGRLRQVRRRPRRTAATRASEYTAAKTTVVRTADAKEDWFAGAGARYG